MYFIYERITHDWLYFVLWFCVRMVFSEIAMDKMNCLQQVYIFLVVLQYRYMILINITCTLQLYAAQCLDLQLTRTTQSALYLSFWKVWLLILSQAHRMEGSWIFKQPIKLSVNCITNISDSKRHISARKKYSWLA